MTLRRSWVQVPPLVYDNRKTNEIRRPSSPAVLGDFIPIGLGVDFRDVGAGMLLIFISQGKRFVVGWLGNERLYQAESSVDEAV